MSTSFFNLHAHDFIRAAVGVPRCRIADPAFNAQQTIALANEAAAHNAVLVLFPELGLSAYTCDDLFQQRALLKGCEQALRMIVEASEKLPLVMVVGLPLCVEHQLFNCAAVVVGGKIAGVVPKSYLPGYGEFYETRQFTSADCALVQQIDLLGQTVPFGATLLFELASQPLCRFHVEICEDVWTPIPPSSFAALAGATVLLNLSASNILAGKAAYRHQLVAQQSARCLAAYLYSSAGQGESTTDMAWDGQALMYENGQLLAQSERFLPASHLIYADIDLERLSHERMRVTTFADSARRHASETAKFQIMKIQLALPAQEKLLLERDVERFPYVPTNQIDQHERCAEVCHIQAQALAQRLSASGILKVVMGVSGGLDSTHALVICAKAMDQLGLPRTHILAFTLPGFGTTERTLRQARQLMKVVGCTAAEIDIRPSCMQMLNDIGHPYAAGQEQFDVTFENVQAGERTSHLFRLANLHKALVVGTGDLSELALGWSTYGVGDHMSHYNVNAGVAKTLIKHLIQWVAKTGQIGQEGAGVLYAILQTEISPELVPCGVGLQPQQKTEDSVGPYELQDFTLYYLLRFGFTPSKIAFLAFCAWHDCQHGQWPDEGENKMSRNEYDLAAIKKNLKIFLLRFFKTSQFKRSCVPNSPKIGVAGSLSPRSDWRAPSDSEATVWLADLDNIPDV